MVYYVIAAGWVAVFFIKPRTARMNVSPVALKNPAPAMIYTFPARIPPG